MDMLSHRSSVREEAVDQRGSSEVASHEDKESLLGEGHHPPSASRTRVRSFSEAPEASSHASVDANASSFPQVNAEEEADGVAIVQPFPLSTLSSTPRKQLEGKQRPQEEGAMPSPTAQHTQGPSWAPSPPELAVHHPHHSLPPTTSSSSTASKGAPLRDIISPVELSLLLRQPPMKELSLHPFPPRHAPPHDPDTETTTVEVGARKGDLRAQGLCRPLIPPTLLTRPAAAHEGRRQDGASKPTTPSPTTVLRRDNDAQKPYAASPSSAGNALAAASATTGTGPLLPPGVTTAEDFINSLDFSDYFFTATLQEYNARDPTALRCVEEGKLSEVGKPLHSASLYGKSVEEEEAAAEAHARQALEAAGCSPVYESPASRVPAPDVMNLALCDLAAVRASLAVHTRRWRRADVLARFKQLVARSIREEERQQQQQLRQEERNEADVVEENVEKMDEVVTGQGRPPLSPSLSHPSRTSLLPRNTPRPSHTYVVAPPSSPSGGSSAEYIIRNSSFLNGPDVIPSGVASHHLQRARAQLIWEYDRNVSRELARYQRARAKEVRAAVGQPKPGASISKGTSTGAASHPASPLATTSAKDIAPSSTQTARERGRVSFMASMAQNKRDSLAAVTVFHQHRQLLPLRAPLYLSEAATGGGSGGVGAAATTTSTSGRPLEDPPLVPPTYTRAWDVDLSDDLTTALKGLRRIEMDQRRLQQQQQRRRPSREGTSGEGEEESSLAGASLTDWGDGSELADAFWVPLPAFVYVISRLLFQVHYAKLFPPGLFAHGLLGDKHYYTEEVQQSAAYYARFFPKWYTRMSKQHQELEVTGGTSVLDSELTTGIFSDAEAGDGPEESEWARALYFLSVAATTDGAHTESLHGSKHVGHSSVASVAPTITTPATSVGRCYRAYLQSVAQLPLVCEEVGRMLSRCRLAAYEFFYQIDTTQRGEVRWSDFSDALIERAEVVHHRTLAEDAAAVRSADATRVFGDGSGGGGGAAGVTAPSVFDRYIVEALPAQLQRSGYHGHTQEVRNSGSLVLLEGPFDIAVCDGSQMGSVSFKIIVREYEDMVADVAAGNAERAEAREVGSSTRYTGNRLGMGPRRRGGRGGGATDGVDELDLAESAALARRPWRQNQKIPSVYIKYEDGKRLNEVAAMEVIEQLNGKRRRKHNIMRARQAKGGGRSDGENIDSVYQESGEEEGEGQGVVSDVQQISDQRSRRVFLQDALVLPRPIFKGMAPVLLTLHTDLSLRLYRTQHSLQAAPESALLKFRETITAVEWAGGCAASDTQLKKVSEATSLSTQRTGKASGGGGGGSNRAARQEERDEVDAYSSLMQTRVFREYLILGTRTGDLKLLHLRPFLVDVPAFHGEDANGLTKHVVYDAGRSTLIRDATRYVVAPPLSSPVGLRSTAGKDKGREPDLTQMTIAAAAAVAASGGGGGTARNGSAIHFHTSVVTSIRTATRDEGDVTEDGSGAGVTTASHSARGGWNVLSASLDGTVCLSKLVAPIQPHHKAALAGHTTTTATGNNSTSQTSSLASSHPELHPVTRIKVCDSGVRRALSVPHAQAIVAQTAGNQVFLFSESNRSTRIELFDPSAPHYAALVSMTVVDGLDQLITADCSGFVKVWSISRAMPLTSFYALSQDAQGGSLQGMIEAGRDDHPSSMGGNQDPGDAGDGVGQKSRLNDESDVKGPVAQESRRQEERKKAMKRKGLDALALPDVDPMTTMQSGSSLHVHRPFHLKPLSSLAYDHTTKLFFAVGMRNAVLCTFASGQGGVKAHGERIRFLGIGRVAHLTSLQGDGADEGGNGNEKPKTSTGQPVDHQAHRSGSGALVSSSARAPRKPLVSQEWLLLSMSSTDGRVWGAGSGTMLLGIRAANPAYDVLAAERLSCLTRSRRPAEDGSSVTLSLLRAAGEDVTSGSGGGGSAGGALWPGGAIEANKRLPHTVDDVLRAVEESTEHRRRMRVRERYGHGLEVSQVPRGGGGGGGACHHTRGTSHEGRSTSLFASAAAGHMDGGGYYGGGDVRGGASSHLSDSSRNANAKGSGGDVLCVCWGQHERSFLYALSTGDIRMHRTDSGRLIKTFLTTPPTLEDILDAVIQHRALYLTRHKYRKANTGSTAVPGTTTTTPPSSARARSPSPSPYPRGSVALSSVTPVRRGGDGAAGASEGNATDMPIMDEEGGDAHTMSLLGCAGAAPSSASDGVRARNEAMMGRAMIKAGMLRAQHTASLTPTSSPSGTATSAAWLTMNNMEKIEAVATLLQRLLLDHINTSNSTTDSGRPSSVTKPSGGAASASPSSSVSLQAHKTSFHLEAVSMHCMDSAQELVVVYADGILRYFPLLGHSLTAHRLVIPEYLVAKCVAYLRGPSPFPFGISGTSGRGALPPSQEKRVGSGDGRDVTRSRPQSASSAADGVAAQCGTLRVGKGEGKNDDDNDEEAVVWAALRPSSSHRKDSTRAASASRRSTTLVSASVVREAPAPSAATARPAAGETLVEADAVSLVAVSAALQLVCVVLVNGTAAVLDVGDASGSATGGGAASGAGFFTSTSTGGGTLLHKFTTAEEVTAAVFLGAYPCLVLADRCRCLRFYLIRGSSLLALHEEFLQDVVRDRLAGTSPAGAPGCFPPTPALNAGGDSVEEEEAERALLSTHVFTYAMPPTLAASSSSSSFSATSATTEGEDTEPEKRRTRHSREDGGGGGGAPTSMHFDPLYGVLYVGTKDGYVRSFLLRRLIVALDLRPLSIAAAHVSLDRYYNTLKAQQAQDDEEAVRNTLFLLFGVTAEEVVQHVQARQQRQRLQDQEGAVTAEYARSSTRARGNPSHAGSASAVLEGAVEAAVWQNSLRWVYHQCRRLLLGESEAAPSRRRDLRRNKAGSPSVRRQRDESWPAHRDLSHTVHGGSEAPTRPGCDPQEDASHHRRSTASDKSSGGGGGGGDASPPALAEEKESVLRVAARRLDLEETQTFFLTSARTEQHAGSPSEPNREDMEERNLVAGGRVGEEGEEGGGADGYPSTPTATATSRATPGGGSTKIKRSTHARSGSTRDGRSPSPCHSSSRDASGDGGITHAPATQRQLPLSLRTATLSDVLLATAVMQDATRLLRLRRMQELEERVQARQGRDSSDSQAASDTNAYSIGWTCHDEGTDTNASASPLRQLHHQLSVAAAEGEGIIRLGREDVTRIRQWIATAVQMERAANNQESFASPSTLPVSANGRTATIAGSSRPPSAAVSPTAVAASTADTMPTALGSKKDATLGEDGIALTSKALVRDAEDEVRGKALRRMRAGVLGDTMGSHGGQATVRVGETFGDADGFSWNAPHPITGQWVEPVFDRHATFMSANTPVALLTPAATLERARRERLEREKRQQELEQQRAQAEAKRATAIAATTAVSVSGSGSRSPSRPQTAAAHHRRPVSALSPPSPSQQRLPSVASTTASVAQLAGEKQHGSGPKLIRTVRDLLRAEGGAVDTAEPPSSSRARSPSALASTDEPTVTRAATAEEEAALVETQKQLGTWDEFIEGTVPRLVLDVFRRPGRVLRDVAKLSQMDLSITVITAHRNGYLFVGHADGTVSLWTPYAGARVDTICAISALPSAIRTLGESVKRQFRRAREAIVVQRKRAAYETDGTLGRNAREGQAKIKAQIKAMLMQHQVSERRAREQGQEEQAARQLRLQDGGVGEENEALASVTSRPASARGTAPACAEGSSLLRELEERRDVLLLTLGIAGEAECVAKHLQLEDLCFLPLRMHDLAEVDAFASGPTSAAAVAYTVAVDRAVRRLFRDVCGGEYDDFFPEKFSTTAPSGSAGWLPSRSPRITSAEAVGRARTASLSPFASGVFPTTGSSVEGETDRRAQNTIDVSVFAAQHAFNDDLRRVIAAASTSEVDRVQLSHEHCVSETALEERWELAQMAAFERELASSAAVASTHSLPAERLRGCHDFSSTQSDAEGSPQLAMTQAKVSLPSTPSRSSLLSFPVRERRYSSATPTVPTAPTAKKVARPTSLPRSDEDSAPLRRLTTDSHTGSEPETGNHSVSATASVVSGMDARARQRVSTMMSIGSASRWVSASEDARAPQWSDSKPRRSSSGGGSGGGSGENVTIGNAPCDHLTPYSDFEAFQRKASSDSASTLLVSPSMAPAAHASQRTTTVATVVTTTTVSPSAAGALSLRSSPRVSVTPARNGSVSVTPTAVTPEARRGTGTAFWHGPQASEHTTPPPTSLASLDRAQDAVERPEVRYVSAEEAGYLLHGGLTPPAGDAHGMQRSQHTAALGAPAGGLGPALARAMTRGRRSLASPPEAPSPPLAQQQPTGLPDGPTARGVPGSSEEASLSPDTEAQQASDWLSVAVATSLGQPLLLPDVSDGESDESDEEDREVQAREAERGGSAWPEVARADALNATASMVPAEVYASARQRDSDNNAHASINPSFVDAPTPRGTPPLALSLPGLPEISPPMRDATDNLPPRAERDVLSSLPRRSTTSVQPVQLAQRPEVGETIGSVAGATRAKGFASDQGEEQEKTVLNVPTLLPPATAAERPASGRSTSVSLSRRSPAPLRLLSSGQQPLDGPAQSAADETHGGGGGGSGSGVLTVTASRDGIGMDGGLTHWRLRAKPQGMRATLAGTGRLIGSAPATASASSRPNSSAAATAAGAPPEARKLLPPVAPRAAGRAPLHPIGAASGLTATGSRPPTAMSRDAMGHGRLTSATGRRATPSASGKRKPL